MKTKEKYIHIFLFVAVLFCRVNPIPMQPQWFLLQLPCGMIGPLMSATTGAPRQDVDRRFSS